MSNSRVAIVAAGISVAALLLASIAIVMAISDRVNLGVRQNKDRKETVEVQQFVTAIMTRGNDWYRLREDAQKLASYDYQSIERTGAFASMLGDRYVRCVFALAMMQKPYVSNAMVTGEYVNGYDRIWQSILVESLQSAEEKERLVVAEVLEYYSPRLTSASLSAIATALLDESSEKVSGALKNALENRNIVPAPVRRESSDGPAGGSPASADGKPEAGEQKQGGQ